MWCLQAFFVCVFLGGESPATFGNTVTQASPKPSKRQTTSLNDLTLLLLYGSVYNWKTWRTVTGSFPPAINATHAMHSLSLAACSLGSQQAPHGHHQPPWERKRERETEERGRLCSDVVTFYITVRLANAFNPLCPTEEDINGDKCGEEYPVRLHKAWQSSSDE